MKTLDMTPVIRKYPGLFVALSKDRKKVFGKGRTAREALAEAKLKGIIDPILSRIPETIGAISRDPDPVSLDFGAFCLGV